LPVAPACSPARRPPPGHWGAARSPVAWNTPAGAPRPRRREARAASKAVLPVADRSEHAHRVGDARAEILVRRVDDRRLAAAQERVRRLLVGERAWHGRRAGLAQLAVARLARRERAVVGLHRLGEADVGERVLVAAIDLRVIWQRSELGKRGVHLLGGAFEEPPAAAGEERVAAEKRACPI